MITPGARSFSTVACCQGTTEHALYFKEILHSFRTDDPSPYTMLPWCQVLLQVASPWETVPKRHFVTIFYLYVFKIKKNALEKHI